MRRILAPGVATLLVLMPLLMATGCSTNPATGKRQLVLISRQQEIAMGEQAAPEFEAQFAGRVPDEELQSYVSMVGQKTAAVCERQMPYEYTLVSSQVPNAFALPGGKIFITAGLMSRMTNERQLAAVLGHETAHVAALHNVQGMQRQMGAAVVVEIAGRVLSGDKGQAAEAATKIATSMANLSYSRGDEYEADQLGIRYMAKAGYNPWGMVELLTVLKNLSDSEPGAFGEMFQTHPLTGKRVAEAQETIQSNSEYASFSPDATDSNRQRFLSMRGRLPAALGKAD